MGGKRARETEGSEESEKEREERARKSGGEERAIGRGGERY